MRILDVRLIGAKRAEERAGIVADAFRPKGSASILLIHRRRDERITWSRAAPGPKPIENSCAQHSLPNSRKTDQWLGNGCQQISRQRYGLSLL
jgi:hypothetical protein